MVQKQGASVKSNSLPFNTEKRGFLDTDVQSSRHWPDHATGFPPGVTVDELRQYRRKRPPHMNRPHDNLHVEDGSLKQLKTEYVRSFHAPSVNEVLTSRSDRKPRLDTSFQLSEMTRQTTLDEYRESFKDFPRQRPKICRPHPNLEAHPNVPMDFITEKSERFVPFRDVERVKSLRRTTALKPEGELITDTENRREFHIHDKIDRIRPIKRENTLKLEGLFENLTSEQKEKYIAFLKSQRPPLSKKQTQLKLEGDLDLSTESSIQYIPPSQQQRPLLRKRSTSLKLNGEIEFWPEYRRNFVGFSRTRPVVPRPSGQLRSEGDLSLDTETRSQFVSISNVHTPKHARVENNIVLEGSFEVHPEYRDQFIKYGRSKSDLIKRADNLTLEGNFCFETEKDKYKKRNEERKETQCDGKEIPAAGLPSKRSQSCNRVKTSEPLSCYQPSNQTPEYRSQFVDFPRRRPTIVRPSGNLTASNDEFGTISEKQSQYHSFGHISKTTPSRRPANLTLNGEFEPFPEYKTAFVEHPISVERHHKPTDSLLKEYPSFQVLEVSQGEIRSSRGPHSNPLRHEVNQSQNSCITPEKSDNCSTDVGASPLDRPTYRLEVHNTNGEAKGFHRSPDRIYPREAIISRPFPSSEKHQEALQAALKRRQSYERSEPFSCKNENLSQLPSPPHSGNTIVDENGNSRSFVVLDAQENGST